MLELILRRDPRLKPLIERFETKEANDMTFLEQIHNLIGKLYSLNLYIYLFIFLIFFFFIYFIIADEAQILYNDLFVDTSLEVGKTLSKSEREHKNLSDEKVIFFLSFFLSIHQNKIKYFLFLVINLWRS